MTRQTKEPLILLSILLFSLQVFAQDRVTDFVVPGGGGGKGTPCLKWPAILHQLTMTASPSCANGAEGWIEFELEDPSVTFDNRNPKFEGGLAKLFKEKKIQPEYLKGWIAAPEEDNNRRKPKVAMLGPYDPGCNGSTAGHLTPIDDRKGTLEVARLTADGFFLYLKGNIEETGSDLYRFTGIFEAHDATNGKLIEKGTLTSNIRLEESEPSDTPDLPSGGDDNLKAKIATLSQEGAELLAKLNTEKKKITPTSPARTFTLIGNGCTPIIGNLPLDFERIRLTLDDGKKCLAILYGSINYSGSPATPPGIVDIIGPLHFNAGILDKDNQLHAVKLVPGKGFLELKGTVSDTQDPDRKQFNGSLRMVDLAKGNDQLFPQIGDFLLYPLPQPKKENTGDSNNPPPSSSAEPTLLLKDLAARETAAAVPADGREVGFTLDLPGNAAFQPIGQTANFVPPLDEKRELDRLLGAEFKGVLRSRSTSGLTLPASAKLTLPFASKVGLLEESCCGDWSLETATPTQDYFAHLKGKLSKNIATDEYVFQEGKLTIRFATTGNCYELNLKNTLFDPTDEIGRTVSKKKLSGASLGTVKPLASPKSASLSSTKSGGGCGVMGGGDPLWLLLLSLPLGFRRKNRS